MKQIEVESERLLIRPRSFEEMEQLFFLETDEETKQAYKEMIDEMKRLPKQEEWAADWMICLKDGREIGGIGFKGAPDESGMVEVGYGILEEFRCQGYAGEAVAAMVNWCFTQDKVRCVRAETAPDNVISKKVLTKNGFVPNGFGEEGPLFFRNRSA